MYKLEESVIYFKAKPGFRAYIPIEAQVTELQKNVRPSMMDKIKVKFVFDGKEIHRWVMLDKVEKKKI
jgi:hypothetical protein